MGKGLQVVKNVTTIGSLLSVSFCISSCLMTGNKRQNAIVSGEFLGSDTYDEAISLCLKVEKIDEEMFSESKGINVVEDEVGGGYYSVALTYIDDANEETRYAYINLKDAYNGATGTPIIYRDDNESSLYPITNAGVAPYYSVHIFDRENDRELYAYLYSKGD